MEITIISSEGQRISVNVPEDTTFSSDQLKVLVKRALETPSSPGLIMPTETKKIKRIAPYSPEWERLANAEARGYVLIKCCRECGGPAIYGSCCNHCDSVDP